MAIKQEGALEPLDCHYCFLSRAKSLVKVLSDGDSGCITRSWSWLHGEPSGRKAGRIRLGAGEASEASRRTEARQRLQHISTTVLALRLCRVGSD
jgi:hypothetical protein